MTQTSRLIAVLKKFLKAKQITYKMLAEHLELSEARVKHLFAEEAFSLKRLEIICDVIGITFHELTKASEKEGNTSHYLTWQQETFLAKSPKIFVLFYLLLQGWETNEIQEKYQFEEQELFQQLIELDQQHLIQLHPLNRVVLQFPTTLRWIENGPIWQLHAQQIQHELLKGSFQSAKAQQHFFSAELSEASLQVLQQKTKAFVSEFETLVELDSLLPEQAKFSIGGILAFRPWTMSLFVDLQRHP